MTSSTARAILDAQAAQLRGTASLIRAKGMFAANAAQASGQRRENIPFTWLDFNNEAQKLEDLAANLEALPA